MAWAWAYFPGKQEWNAGIHSVVESKIIKTKFGLKIKIGITTTEDYHYRRLPLQAVHLFRITEVLYCC